LNSGPNTDTDPDPAFRVNPDPRVLLTKIEENTVEIFFYIFFDTKIAIYLCPRYRRSLQSSKRTSSTLKNELSFVFGSLFALPIPDPDSARFRIWIQGAH
jgi:hypothetical protein